MKLSHKNVLLINFTLFGDVEESYKATHLLGFGSTNQQLKQKMCPRTAKVLSVQAVISTSYPNWSQDVWPTFSRLLRCPRLTKVMPSCLQVRYSCASASSVKALVASSKTKVQTPENCRLEHISPVNTANSLSSLEPHTQHD